MQTGPFEYQAIGHIRSPHQSPQGAPIQPCGARGVRGTLEIFPEYAPGLKDLAGFSHVIVLYHCHLSKPAELTVVPFLDGEPRGVFATRAPARPNPIGLSVLALLGIEGNQLQLSDVDILDGTPVLDIKPYVPGFDHPDGEIKTGWLQKKAARALDAKADQRFEG